MGHGIIVQRIKIIFSKILKFAINEETNNYYTYISIDHCNKYILTICNRYSSLPCFVFRTYFFRPYLCVINKGSAYIRIQTDICQNNSIMGYQLNCVIVDWKQTNVGIHKTSYANSLTFFITLGLKILRLLRQKVVFE